MSQALRMPLFVAVVGLPLEWHMRGYKPQKISARFACSNICTPTLKIVAPPLNMTMERLIFCIMLLQ